MFLIRPLSHDGMTAEDENFRAYLVEHGYDVSQLGMRSESDSVEDVHEKIATPSEENLKTSAA